MARANHLRVANGKNPFKGVDSKEYDPDGFYVSAQDHNGHTAQTRVTLHPDTKAQIDVLLATGKLAGTPINTYQALMRDAAVHGLHRIGRVLRDPDIIAVAERQMMLAKADMMADEIERLTRVVNDAKQRFDLVRAERDKAGLADFLDIYEAVLPTLRDPFRTRLVRVLDEARGSLKE